jgi:hypothetical protein
MKKLALFLCLLWPLFVQGHAGGHYAKGDLLKIWHLQNGKYIEGNFAYGNSESITVELLHGDMQTILLADLQTDDRKIAEIKLNRYKSINGQEFTEPLPKSSKPSFPEIRWIAFYLIAILALHVYADKNQKKWRQAIGVACLFVGVIWACKTESTISPSNPSTSTNTSTKTSISFLDSAFAPYKKTISTNYDDTYYYVNSNGMPEHNMMVGITSWQQQVPIPQPYSGSNHWSIPLKPVYETTPLSTKTNFMKGAVALAVNGIPIFNALNNRGEDSFAIGELDQWGGHCGRADDYHYHTAPLHLTNTSGFKPIAFALDGYAVYGAKEPDGTAIKALDAYHGHELLNMVYHYHGTTDYPYVIGSMRGKVSTDPATPAPENQILPQAFTNSVRPALTALKGARITNFETLSPTAYVLTYSLNAKNYTVKYSWVNSTYTFVFTDGEGKQSTETYTRK